MPTKKSIDAADEYWQAVLFYQWEFLRRNRDFLKDAQPLYALEGNIAYSKTKQEKKITERRYFDARQLFVEKWGLHPQYRPIFSEWNYFACLSSGNPPLAPATEPFVVPDGKFERIKKRKLEHFFASKFMPRNARICSGGKAFYASKSIRKMAVVIDFKKSKTQILHEVSRLIDVIQTSAGSKTPGRIRLDNYRDYLRIYDYVRSGESFQSIANILYPSKKNRLKRVNDYYRAVTNLINKASK